MTDFSDTKQPKNATAVILFADKTVLWGRGFGAETAAVGELCFNTSMSGYQEVLTDPSYAGQIINFTFPHIGNVGTNDEDMETQIPASKGCVVREDVTDPSNWRSTKHLDQWLKDHNLPGISGIDTRALTKLIRDKGAPNVVLAYNADGEFDLEALHKEALNWPGLKGMDLAKEVSCKKPYDWDEKCWRLNEGYTKQINKTHKVVAIDFGAKLNILRCLAEVGFDVTVVPADTSAADILKYNPDGIFLSNGPGDPEATSEYVTPVLKELFETGIPMFGICLGHQLISLALGAKTQKMHLGHRGGNQPVKDLLTGKVEITSQNHGFEVVKDSLPANAEESHISLFDGSNEGIRVTDKPIFTVQYHPEASPGPNDSFYLFERFRDLIEETKKKAA
ncbi:MAG: glutamine-hydrolyzing carbamoyl-phosphate synthase small subunit [Pseudomonadota bacterium]